VRKGWGQDSVGRVASEEGTHVTHVQVALDISSRASFG